MKHFHTDGGTEYNRAEHELVKHGVKVTRTPVYTPQHNGIAERKGRTLLDMTRAMLLHAKLDPDLYWRDAFLTAVIVHNRVNIRQPFGKTQHELFTQHKPNLSLFRVFGCDAVVRIPRVELDGKLGPRGVEGIFVGYDLKRECYRVRVESETVVSRDVKFSEDKFTVQRAGVSEIVKPPSEKSALVPEGGASELNKPSLNDYVRAGASSDDEEMK